MEKEQKYIKMKKNLYRILGRAATTNLPVFTGTIEKVMKIISRIKKRLKHQKG